MRTPLFHRRTANSYASHKKRARKVGQVVDYTLEELRAKVEEAMEKGQCYCRCAIKEDNFSCDHAHPVSRGGSFSLVNVEIICERCNCAKGLLHNDEFEELWDVIGDWPEIARKDLLARLRAGGRMRR